MSYSKNKEKKHRKRHSRSDQTDVGFASIAKSALIGSGYSLAGIIILSIIVSALCLMHSDPATITLPIGLAVLYASACLGGVIASKKFKQDKGLALTAGAVCGFILFFVTGIGSAVLDLVFSGSSHGLKLFTSLFLRAICIPTSLLGAYMGMSRKKKYRKKRR